MGDINKGYDPTFLEGFDVPLPEPSDSLVNHLYVGEDGTTEIKHQNYSLVMNKDNRAPVFVALNISQNEIRATKRNDKWKLDPKVPKELQLGHEYYGDVKIPGQDKKEENPYDKGHMAMRKAAGWGDHAQSAADETFYYTNSVLQHKNLNRDEWLKLETWTMEHEEDADGLICEFSGPFFSAVSLFVDPATNKRNAQGEVIENKYEKAPIPDGFFKLVAYKNRQNRLQVRAFIIYQDQEAKRGYTRAKDFDHAVYQVTTAEVEKLTGLRFHEDLARANPLYAHNRPETMEERSKLCVCGLPEHVDVADSTDIVGPNKTRDAHEEKASRVFIAGALINPSQRGEAKHEWVSIINLSSNEVDLEGWYLRDTKHRERLLGGLGLQPGEATVVGSLSPMRLLNSSGTITLLNSRKEIVHRVHYQKTEEGVPNIFNMA